ncbi:MAG: hypothetical protein QOD68_2351 [Actinomycetota bacterium]|nr:hypothetical protein [Actinomycetota bacterium]
MIFVAGGTGELGGRVVRLLREQGHAVRCLLRPGSDGDALRSQGAELVVGDLANPATLSGACDGAETVVATATVIGRRLAGARRPSIRDVDQAGMAALIDAAEASSVERFVYVSFAGADAQLGTPLERAKIATEQRLRRSSMRSVIVRPDAFQDIHLAPIGRFDIAAGQVAVFGKGDTKRRWVSTDDVAALVAALAVEPDPPAMVEFGGPEALSRNEAIAIAEQATGRSIKRQRLPRPLTRLGMRLLARPNDALASVFGAGLLQDLVASGWDDAPLKERGINAKPASQFIREQALGDG